MFNYLYLFVFLDLGFIILKNCVLMGFMYVGFEEVEGGYDCMVVFYVECVVGGVGLIVIGGILLNDYGVIFYGGFKLDILEEVEKYKVII